MAVIQSRPYHKHKRYSSSLLTNCPTVRRHIKRPAENADKEPENEPLTSKFFLVIPKVQSKLILQKVSYLQVQKQILDNGVQGKTSRESEASFRHQFDSGHGRAVSHVECDSTLDQ